MASAIHLNATYCEHEREHVRRYRRVVSPRPAGSTQSEVPHAAATFVHPSSYNRKAAAIKLAAAGQFDTYA